MDWDYAINVVGPWALRQTNITLNRLELSLEKIETRIHMMFSNLLPELPHSELINKTILINRPQSRNHLTNEQLKKYATSLVSDVKS